MTFIVFINILLLNFQCLNYSGVHFNIFYIIHCLNGNIDSNTIGKCLVLQIKLILVVC